MDTWDARFPFPVEEATLFARLHQKATKFAAPPGIQFRENTASVGKAEVCEDISDNEDNDADCLKLKLGSLKSTFDYNQSLLRNLDLLLEAHKQLSLAVPSANLPGRSVAESPRIDQVLEEQLQRVQGRIAHIEAVQSAKEFIASCSVPSVASSPLFLHSLKLITDSPVTDTETEIIINRAFYLMQKCWDNALVAMERVLDRDLTSIEAYLDDPVYKDLKNLVLKPLLIHKNRLPRHLLNHFAASYAQLRINFVKFVLDTRLNSQFDSLQPKEQVLHLIERTRLIMSQERKEYGNVFESPVSSDAHPPLEIRLHLNKILESVGNLLFQRMEPLCSTLQSNSRDQVSQFIHPLMRTILENDQNDPFGLFLKLLTERFFKEVNPLVLNV